VNEVSNWVEGRRIPFKPLTQPGTASRPYVLDEIPHVTTRGLARALVLKGGDAVETVNDKGLLTWLQRALPLTSKCKDMLPRALDDSEERDANIQGQRLVTRVAMALDPTAPIRYRGISAHPEALGTVLAAANLGDGTAATIKSVAEIVKARLVQFWTECQTNTEIDYDIWRRDQDRLRQFLNDHRPGFGIERVTYELNRHIHCLSPAIETVQVASIEELLPALEQAAERGTLGAQGVDRHIAAFIASRTKIFSEAIATMLSHAEPAERFLGSLALLSRIQADHGPAKLRSLTTLFRPQVIPLINRFHNRNTRRRLQGATEDAIASGKLSLLLETLNNPEERLRDQQEFNRATVRCAEAQRNIRICAHDLELAPLHGEETAQTISQVLAALTGAAVVAFAVFSALTT
jgi:eukaryotic-like serine/threonine-protein kinase